MRGGLAAQLSGQRLDLQFFDRFRNLCVDIHPILFLEPGRGRSGATAVHACRSANHHRTDDVQAFFREEQTAAIRIEQRAQIGAIITPRTMILAAFQ
jgi:hypothetical protein